MRECPECGGRWPDGTETCPEDGARLVAEGADPYIGQPVGSYVVTRCLGRGGMGAVYEAQHPTIGSRVAVKFLHRRYSADEAIVDRFFNEARAVNVIGHDNIIHVSDFNRMEDGSPYFIMEFLEGRPLTELVGQPQPLSVTGPIFLQVTEGLLAAHEKGIIHRDLKPDNLFLVNRGRRANFVKIVDFGIAKLQGPDAAASGRTATGMVMGTAQYMSPEQAGGEVGRISPASDVYSLGVIMFQLATGRLPFEGKSFGEILVGHLMQPPPPPRSLEPSVPEGYEAVILRCLEKKPEDRYGSMDELFEALGAVLDAEGLSRDLPLARSGPRSDPGMNAPVFTPHMSAPPASKPPRAASRPPRPGPPSTRPTTDEQRGHTVLMNDSEPGATGTVVLGERQKEVYVPQRKAKKSPAAAIAAVAVVLVAGGTAAFLALRPKAPAPVETAQAQVPVAPPEPVKPATVEVTIVSNPPGAKVTLRQGDAVHEGTTPTTLPLAPQVAVVATLAADGFDTLEERFTPEKAMELRYVLVASPPPEPEPKPVVRKRDPPKRPIVEKPVAKIAPAPKPAEKKTPVSVGDGIVDVEF